MAPLALAVLALLFERLMHPYEMGIILKERHKQESFERFVVFRKKGTLLRNFRT